MSVALKFRPNGRAIIDKFQGYLKRVDPKDNIDEDFIEACEALKDDPAIFLEMLNVASILYPENAKLSSLRVNNQLVINTQLKIQELESQIDLLRNKFNLMHKALCYSEVLKVKEIDDHSAKLSPVEYFDKGADSTLVVFGGMATRPSMPPKEFFSSFYDKDINIIFVKDFQQCWYQQGLIGLTEDPVATVAYIKGLIPKQSKKTTFLGTSAGGYAAIRFGVEINADRIIAFSPQTNLNAKTFEKFKSLDSRISDIKYDIKYLDLKNLLIDSKQFSGSIEIHYGLGNKADSAAALRISDYASLHEYSTDSHNIASYLKNIGVLPDILESI